jgi:transposase-like protein
MAKKKASVRKSFSPEIKAEALRLIREEGYTAKQAAEYAGCSTFSIQQWKATEPGAKSAKKSKRRKRKNVVKMTVGITPTEKPPITFDEFVQEYWNECEGASDVLRLPPDIMPKAVQYVNNVLQYAYDRFCER